MVDLAKLSKQELLVEIAALHTKEQNLKQNVLERTEELRQIHEQLRSAQALLNSVLANSREGIAVLKPARNEAGQIVAFEWLLVNPQAEKIMGVSAEQLIGKRTPAELGPIELFKDYVRVVETGEPFQTEAFYEFKDIERWIDIVAVKFDDGLAVTLRDISEQRKTQQSIRQLNEALSAHARELTAANRELREFSYSISHDLRAPLRAVNGFAQIIGRRYHDELNDEARHYLANILEAGSRMEQLIDDLLIYSRLGRTITPMEPVALGLVLNRAAEAVAGQIQELGAELKLPEETPNIQGDHSLLKWTFVNLFDNALKYRRPEIPPRIEVTVRLEGDSAVINVQDNGIGIPKEHQAEIFDVFHRLHPPEAYPGTGIGLAIVRKSLRLMRGTVSVDSTPGEGSVFHIKLPLVDKKRYNEG